jgi:hypothetical protein
VVVTWLALEGQSNAQVAINQFLAKWRWIRPRADGDSLRALGLAAGPAYSDILRKLRDAWLDGELSSEAEEAELLARLVRGSGSNG